MKTGIDEMYLKHPVFDQLNKFSDFYDSLSYSIMGWLNMGTAGLINLDTYVYSSTQGTLESIYSLLKIGRINDGYALLRKYYDSTIINVYSNLFLLDNFTIENFIVAQIDNWQRGKDKLPEFRIMSQYIRNSPRLTDVNNLLHSKQAYKDIRERCNDHTHYNYYRTLLLNDNEIHLNNERIEALDTFSADLEDIFIQHLSYIFYFQDHYMSSSDYVDALDVGCEPEEGSQYYVAPFIQDILNEVVRKKRPDIYLAIKNKTPMRLE